ncbi:MAG: trigger factor [Verrucomicrobia bacterium]|nr:trigger factor [Verrucomicrobiota bacterium]
MNVTVENVAACRKRLSIEVPADEVSREWQGAVTEIQKVAQIPGFRPGRAPRLILERKFQKEISDEVQRKLIPQSFREAIAKEKLKVVSLPTFDDVKFTLNEPLRFLATVDVAPDFQLPVYKGLKVKKTKVEVKDSEVEDSLKLLAEQQASFSDVADRGLAFGDFAVISYSGVCEGKAVGEFSEAARPLSENKQFWLLMAKDSFLPGFCDSLTGGKIGDRRQALVDFPSNFRIKELAGRKATYFVEIIGIKEKKLPAMDDAFAAGYKAANVAELKAKVRESMIADREHQARRETQNQIVEQLLKATPFDVPESVLHAETRSTVADIVQRNHRMGLKDETIRERSKEIFEFAQQSAKDKVRASFILGKIAETEKIEVKDEEIQEQVRLAAERAHKPVKEFAQKLDEGGELDALREQMLIGRTLDLLVAQAVIEAA